MFSNPILLIVPALALVLGLIVLAGRIARASGLAPRSGDSGRVALVHVLALDTRRRLHLVRCDGRHVLLLTGGAQDVVVGWLGQACKPDPSAAPADYSR